LSGTSEVLFFGGVGGDTSAYSAGIVARAAVCGLVLGAVAFGFDCVGGACVGAAGTVGASIAGSVIADVTTTVTITVTGVGVVAAIVVPAVVVRAVVVAGVPVIAVFTDALLWGPELPHAASVAPKATTTDPTRRHKRAPGSPASERLDDMPIAE